MKKMMVMLLVLAMSISCLVLPAGAVQVEGNPCDTHMAVQPREIMTFSIVVPETLTEEAQGDLAGTIIYGSESIRRLPMT